MNARQHRAAQKYVNALLPSLGLHGWSVDVFDDFLEEDDVAVATVLKQYGRRAAGVWFREDFFSAPPEYQRHVVVHELLHCAWAEPETYVYDVLENHVPALSHALIADSFRLHQEHAIDALAVALCPLFPLPELP